MPTHCTHCGNPLPPGTPFCPACGQQVAPAAPPNPAQAPPPPQYGAPPPQAPYGQAPPPYGQAPSPYGPQAQNVLARLTALPPSYRWIAAAAVALILWHFFSPSARGPATGIVSKWHGTTTYDTPGQIDTGSLVTDMEFKADNTFTLAFTSPKTNMTGSGTYTLAGTTLKITTTEVNDGTGPKSLPPGYTPPSETYLVTLSGDNLTLDRQGIPAKIVLQRVP